MGFPRQEYWSGLPCPTPGALPQPRNRTCVPVLTGRFFTTVPPGKATGEGGGLLETPLDSSSWQSSLWGLAERPLRTGRGFPHTLQPGMLLEHFWGHSYATKLQEADKSPQACSLLGDYHLFSQSKSSYVYHLAQRYQLSSPELASEELPPTLLLMDTIFSLPWTSLTLGSLPAGNKNAAD